MGILLDQQALKIIFVGLTENAYCNSRKKAMGWLPRSGLVLQSVIELSAGLYRLYKTEMKKI